MAAHKPAESGPPGEWLVIAPVNPPRGQHNQRQQQQGKRDRLQVLTCVEDNPLIHSCLLGAGDTCHRPDTRTVMRAATRYALILVLVARLVFRLGRNKRGLRRLHEVIGRAHVGFQGVIDFDALLPGARD